MDVDDDVRAIVGRAREPEAERLAHRRPRAVAGDQPVGAQPVGPLRRFELKRHTVVAALETRELRLPADLDELGRRFGTVGEELLADALLEVHHRREPLVPVHRHLQPVNRHIAVEARARGPGQRLAEDVARATPSWSKISRLRREMQAARLP